MSDLLLQKKWKQEARHIRTLTKDDLKKILLKGRYPNNNTFPPLYKLKPTYEYSGEKIEYLCPRKNKTPRKYTIPAKSKYERLVRDIVNCWEEVDTTVNFKDQMSVKSLILSNKKILPVSSSILSHNNSNLNLNDIYSASIKNWKEFTQYHLYEDSINFKYLLEMDIKDFYSQIYVHSIPWALTGDKEKCKQVLRNDRKIYRLLGSSKIEDSIMNLQDRQTNGIPIGPLGSDIIGEILLCRVVRNIEKALKGINYIGIRFKDDFKILCKSKEDAEKILDMFADELSNLGLYLNDDKTRISSDFSVVVMQQWYKKILKLPTIKFDPNKDEYTKGELVTLEKELFTVFLTIQETIKPSDGNFWYEFENRYSKHLKIISNKYPEGKGRIVIWLIDRLNDYSEHSGVIIKILMSLISMRDAKYLKIIRKRLVQVATQRNYDFCMIWIIYFITEKYLSSKYDESFDAIIEDMKGDLETIANEDIRNESGRLLDYIYSHRKELKGRNPVSKTFRNRWNFFIDY